VTVDNSRVLAAMIQHFLPMLAALLLHIASCSAAPTVTITSGTIIGVEDAASATQQFLGIPFAEPPINDYRLRQAIPPTKPFGTLQANAFGASCYQKGRDDVSEDCLTLNIWRPSTASTSNATLPVMVWLYGGGLTSGATADPTFEGTAITRISKEIGKPIILVTVNYRLGPFGFLSGKEMAELGLLNMGMLDQRLAFRWIQENIAAFGGDPRKVTLAGESAGAVSIYSHMMAYGGRNDNLFRGAILQSGGAFPLTGPNTTAFQSTFDSLISKTNCSALKNTTAEEKLGCVRKLPVDVFRAAVGPSTGQSVDGEIFRTSIQRALPAGEYIKVPTIVGGKSIVANVGMRADGFASEYG
jgi:carboxylesterase type B